MLWVKAFHIIFMVAWFSGLFYLPRLFVYHAMSNDTIGIERFKIMERKLYYGIATPNAVLTILFGVWLFTFNPQFYLHSLWFHFKISFVVLLVIYHIYLGMLLKDFRNDRNKHDHVFYRIINEVSLLFLITIVILVVVKPFGIILR